jgi:DNA-binding transcriptional ArsR family regulator
VSESSRYGRAGWTIQQSIALELDIALAILGGRDLFTEMLLDDLTFLRHVPSDWQALLPEMLGDAANNTSVIEYAASMTGVLLGEDYEQVTLAIRELTMAEALNRVERRAAQFDLSAHPDLPLFERLVDLQYRLHAALYTSTGLNTVSSPYQYAWRKSIERAVRILRDGDLHSRFWFWLDRFYFEVYRPWRETRKAAMEMLKKRALLALGAEEKYGVPPDLSWLPAQNALLRVPELSAAVDDGRFTVCFCVEPLGLIDNWTIDIGLVIVSFAESVALLQKFSDLSSDLAVRANALADPTRLMILRIIRHFGAINTEIAEYLQLARPTVSVHAKILREAGLIRSHQEGRQVRHEIVPSEVRQLFRDLERYLDLPDEKE